MTSVQSDRVVRTAEQKNRLSSRPYKADFLIRHRFDRHMWQELLNHLLIIVSKLSNNGDGRYDDNCKCVDLESCSPSICLSATVTSRREATCPALDATFFQNSILGIIGAQFRFQSRQRLESRKKRSTKSELKKISVSLIVSPSLEFSVNAKSWKCKTGLATGLFKEGSEQSVKGPNCRTGRRSKGF